VLTGLNDFLKIVRENAIATDAESASNLHRVLSHGRTTRERYSSVVCWEPGSICSQASWQ